MADYNITMVRGDTLSFGLEIEGLEQDLETAFFSCKSSYSAPNYAFQKSLNDGITKVDTGSYRVRVAPGDTQQLEAGTYYYDLQIGVNNDIFTILRGALAIEHEITD